MARVAASRLAAVVTSSKSKLEVFSRHLPAASSARGTPSRLLDPGQAPRLKFKFRYFRVNCPRKADPRSLNSEGEKEPELVVPEQVVPW
uniref:Uncharacterized protein n=1 Tax=Aegilops tauschii TaxID=37682 RepID=M8AVM8_AEGTA